MTYYESAEGQRITLERALAEVKRHGLESESKLFLAQCWARYYVGSDNGATIDAKHVLEWMGY